MISFCVQHNLSLMIASSIGSMFSPTVSTTIQEPKKPFFTKTVIIIIAAAVGGVLVMALIIIIMAICCVVVKKRIKKGNCLVHMYFIKKSNS